MYIDTVLALSVSNAKLVLITLIIILFVLKPLAVSFYLQRSGDYFPPKLFNWYSKTEIHHRVGTGRKKVMIIANWLNTILWLAALLLGALSFF